MFDGFFPNGRIIAYLPFGMKVFPLNDRLQANELISIAGEKHFEM